ncbi:aspartate 1-decarboxylase [Paraburkholderia sp. HP33-1]|uniref:aspartate 1-decarboxylase n=1 Tax=Paraburkholderia sp. HP33-1 TaxID=2883243 RepID=UPI001F476DA8|nr:aspartate 1-decarboxylase [Paraburkholderia sp. HP33-1]
MQRHMLRSKIHRAVVTHCELHYEGSCAIDEDLLDAAAIVENERINVWNIDNGERFSTYAIKGERGSGMVSLNGSAARRAHTGDLVIIAAFASVDETELAAGWRPKLVFADDRNMIKGCRDQVPTQNLS